MIGFGLSDEIIISSLRAEIARLSNMVAESEMEAARAKFDLRMLEKKKMRLKYNWKTGKAELIKQ